ncbi:two-component response regulator, partial [Actinoplanes sp. NPDC048791]
MPITGLVQPAEFDDSTAEYWARQIRIGASVAAGVTMLGCVRVAVDWVPDRRWLLGPVLAAALVQLVAALLPWARLVRSARVRSWLVLWWAAELPLLFLFSRLDQDGLMLYLPGVALI